MALDDFKYIWNSPEGRVVTEWPVLFLVACSTKNVQTEDDSSIAQEHELLFEIQIVGGDPDTLTANIFKYVRAVDAIWRTMTAAQLAAGLSISHNYGAMIDSIDHDYDVLRGDATTGYMRRAHLKVNVSIVEVQ